MKYGLSESLNKKLEKIQKKQPQLSAKIYKQLKFFAVDDTHPSLDNHKLKGELENFWSIRIDESVRMIYYIKEDKAVFFDVGTHDEVYRRN